MEFINVRIFVSVYTSLATYLFGHVLAQTNDAVQQQEIFHAALQRLF